MVLVLVAVVVVHVPHNAGQRTLGTTPTCACISKLQRSAVILAHSRGSGKPPGQAAVVVVIEVDVVTVVCVVVVVVEVVEVTDTVVVDVVDDVAVVVVVVVVVAVTVVAVDVVVVLQRPLKAK